MKRRAFIKTAAGLFVPSVLGQGFLSRRTGAVAYPTAAPAVEAFALGYNEVADANDSWGPDSTQFYRAQAAKSGILTKAYFYVNSTTATEIKIAVYESSTTTPAAGDDLIGVSDSFVGGGSAGWWPAGGANISGTIVSGAYYWICSFVSSANGIALKQESSGGSFYETGSGDYASNPTDANNIVESSYAKGRISMYVTAT